MNKPNLKTVNDEAKDGMEQFFTEEQATKGIRLPLLDKLGRKTEHWLHIIGGDSEEFRIARQAANREAAAIAAIDDAGVRDKANVDAERSLAARLVKDWSFDQPCTHENVVAFFKRAPQIQNSVDMAASRRVLFVNADSPSSHDAQSTSSG